MPDLGGVGRGLLKKVTDRDENDDKTEAPAAPDTELALADEPEEHADGSEVRELAELLQQLLESRRPPAGPITAPWSFGFGDLLGEHPKVPKNKKVRDLVKSLNRFGGIELTPQEITFDGDDVPWEKVTEVRTRSRACRCRGSPAASACWTRWAGRSSRSRSRPPRSSWR